MHLKEGNFTERFGHNVSTLAFRRQMENINTCICDGLLELVVQNEYGFSQLSSTQRVNKFDYELIFNEEGDCYRSNEVNVPERGRKSRHCT